MDGFAVAGLHVNGLNVHVGVEVRGDDELPIFVFAFGFDFVFDRHFGDPVGFTECPTVVEFGGRWHGIKVASRRAGFDPVCNHLDFGVSETALVLKSP